MLITRTDKNTTYYTDVVCSWCGVKETIPIKRYDAETDIMYNVDCSEHDWHQFMQGNKVITLCPSCCKSSCYNSQ